MRVYKKDLPKELERLTRWFDAMAKMSRDAANRQNMKKNALVCAAAKEAVQESLDLEKEMKR